MSGYNIKVLSLDSKQVILTFRINDARTNNKNQSITIILAEIMMKVMTDRILIEPTILIERGQ